jgi:hypothetical protein
MYYVKKTYFIIINTVKINVIKIEFKKYFQALKT